MVNIAGFNMKKYIVTLSKGGKGVLAVPNSKGEHK